VKHDFYPVWESILKLLKKEYLLKLRGGETLIGLIMHGVLYTLLLAFLIRNLSARIDEMHLVAIPAIWIIFLGTVVRYNIQSFTKEVRGGIFRLQLSYGYPASSLFWSKILNSLLIVLMMLIFEFLAFGILMGQIDLLKPLLLSFLVFAISLPAVLITAALAAIISLCSEKEEVLMPIVLIPLLLLLSLSVMSLAEGFFHGQPFDFTSFWLQLIIGETIILALLAAPLFNYLVNQKD